VSDPTPEIEPALPEPPTEVPPQPLPPQPGPAYDEATLWALVFEYLRQIKGIAQRTQELATYIADNHYTLEWDVISMQNVSGSGSANTVAKADGFLVGLLATPAHLGHSEGGHSVFDAGWFGWSTAFFGRGSMKPITRDGTLFYPLGTSATGFQWELAPGVTARVVTLRRKPYPDQEFDGPGVET
jgi:hypothetical protein